MLQYSKIDQLFGAPLNTVIVPHVPFKLKGWHLVVAGVTLFLVVKGAKAYYEDYQRSFSPKVKKKGD